MGYVIFIGNGVNRISNKLSWNNLLLELQKEDFQGTIFNPQPIPESLPSTLKYEFILLSSYFGHKRDVYEKEKEDRQLRLKQSIAQKMRMFVGNEIYNRLVNLPSVQFITTNYDHVLDNALVERGFNFMKKDFSENLYNIRRFRAYENGGNTVKIYPIHGDMGAPKSITIDYNHYCGTVAKIDAYLKGAYNWGNGIKISSIETRIQSGEKHIHSWIDHFFFSDIYILGFSLEWVEIELWWLLDKRRRYQRKGLKIENKIVYNFMCSEEEISKNKNSEKYAKYMMLEKLGVQCRFADFMPKSDQEYLQAYHLFLDKIEREVAI